MPKWVVAAMFAALMLVDPLPTAADPLPAERDDYRDHREMFRENGPITPAERNAPWPSRDQPAKDYRDAFCQAWDDACMRCERDQHGSRAVACHPMSADEVCERKTIVCKEELPTAARVCLIYDDGCNLSSLGSGIGTAVLCRSPKDGRPPPRRGRTCTVPRRSTYDEGYPHARDDLAGHWWLTTPRGEACLVTLNSVNGLWTSAPCSPVLLSRLSIKPAAYEAWNSNASSCSYDVKQDRLIVVCPNEYRVRATDKRFTLTFSIRDIDNPIGVGATKNWRLLRISTLF